MKKGKTLIRAGLAFSLLGFGFAIIGIITGESYLDSVHNAVLCGVILVGCGCIVEAIEKLK